MWDASSWRSDCWKHFYDAAKPNSAPNIMYSRSSATLPKFSSTPRELGAVESAWKAVYASRPGKLLVLDPGFHGRSIATSQLSSTARSELAQSMAPLVVHQSIEPEFLWGSDLSRSPSESCFLRYISQHHQDLCGVLVDPALSARGYLLPKSDFLLELRRLTCEYGLPLISDEIQCGLGRCAPFSLSLQQGWKPDLLLLGKSLGGGISPYFRSRGISNTLGRDPSRFRIRDFCRIPARLCHRSASPLFTFQHSAYRRRMVCDGATCCLPADRAQILLKLSRRKICGSLHCGIQRAQTTCSNLCRSLRSTATARAMDGASANSNRHVAAFDNC